MSCGNRLKNNLISRPIIQQQDITITAEDGFPLAATLFINDSKAVSKAIVFGSALGVPRYIYFKLAQFFAEQGFAVLTFDYRGVHESNSDTTPGSKMQMADWGALDINAALGKAIDEWQPNTLVYLAHSCGGQLLGLAPNSTKIDKAIFIASQSGYWNLWPVPLNWATWLVWNSFSVLTPLFDEFPARALGLSSVNIPSGVARQWAQWGKSSNYLWDHISQQDYDRYQQLSFNLLSIGFTDDRYFGPARAVEKLLDYYPSVRADLHSISPSDFDKQSIGHFGFLKDDFEQTLWTKMAEWLQIKK